MLQLEDLATIQALLRAYSHGRCTLEQFVREARSIIARYHPHLTPSEINARVGQILARIPA